MPLGAEARRGTRVVRRRVLRAAGSRRQEGHRRYSLMRRGHACAFVESFEAGGPKAPSSNAAVLRVFDSFKLKSRLALQGWWSLALRLQRCEPCRRWLSRSVGFVLAATFRAANWGGMAPNPLEPLSRLLSPVTPHNRENYLPVKPDYLPVNFCSASDRAFWPTD